MDFLSVGNIHGDVERFKKTFDLILDEYDFDVVLFTGNFGSYNSARRTIEYVSKKGFPSVSVYGSDDDYYLKKLLRGGKEHHIMNGVILGLGSITRVGGYRVLGIGGLKGSGRYWYEWRDRTIAKIMENVEGRRIDIVLAYEFPKNYSERCLENDVCGRFILKKLVEEVDPAFYFGGRNHATPRAYEYPNGTIIVETGSIVGNEKNYTYITLARTSKKQIITFKIHNAEQIVEKKTYQI